MKMGTRGRIALALLVAVHGGAFFAGLVAPYDPITQHREYPYAPPMRLRFLDEAGRFHARPFVYALRERPGQIGSYEEDRSVAHPVRLLVRRHETGPSGFPRPRVRLFGVEEPGELFLLGTDGFGRDQLSRLLYGGRISLLAGLATAALALAIAIVVGTVAGFHAGWVDSVAMRIADVFLAVPWLYALLAVRAALPLHVAPGAAFLVVVGVIGLVDWPRSARLVRGIALSARERGFVLAARGFGASGPYLMRRHVAPQASGVLLTQAALLVPQYVMAEVMMSFLGLGVSEPQPSWGAMLASLQEYRVLTSCWWMWAPAVALAAVFLAYFALAESLQNTQVPVRT